MRHPSGRGEGGGRGQKQQRRGRVSSWLNRRRRRQRGGICMGCGSGDGGYKVEERGLGRTEQTAATVLDLCCVIRVRKGCNMLWQFVFRSSIQTWSDLICTAIMTGSIVVPFDFRTLHMMPPLAFLSLCSSLLGSASRNWILRSRASRRGKVSGHRGQAWQCCVLPIQGCTRSGTLDPSLTDQTNPYAESAMNGESKE